MPRKKPWKANRDLVLFVSTIPKEAIDAFRAYKTKKGNSLRLGVILHNKYKQSEEKLAPYDVVIRANFDSPKSVIKNLKPHEDSLLAISCRSEQRMQDFKKLIPYVPFLRTPTADSIDWATDKLKMRRRFHAYDSSITPKYMVAKDGTQETIDKIKKKIDFPLVVKPASLAQSLLVSLCFHEEDLEKALRKSLRTVKKHYKERKLKEEPKIIVEEFMEGSMYSIDSYVGTRGQVYHCPPVYVETGRSIGFDDFFNYYQVTPTRLSKLSIRQLQEVTEKGIHALGLRNVTTHTELLRTEEGWKIIEIGGRIGGFRQKFYDLSYDIDHTMNDVKIRIPERPKLPRKVKGYSGILKFYARKEGRLQSIRGLKKIQDLPSVHEIDVKREKGEMCRFAKNGGKSVLNVILFHESRQQFIADKRRIEQAIQIATTSGRAKKSTSKK